jgi:hypothetical protein
MMHDLHQSLARWSRSFLTAGPKPAQTKKALTISYDLESGGTDENSGMSPSNKVG